jgi:putative ABC transport system permease protein
VTNLLRKSWRGLWARRWQTVGLAALVAISVTTTAGSTRARRILAYTKERIYEDLALADLEIRCGPIREGIVDRVRDWPEIADAEERLIVPGVFRSERTPALPAFVTMLSREPPRIDRLSILEGRYPAPEERGVVLDRSLASVYGLGVGDEVELELRGETVRVPVVGVSASPEHLFTPCHPVYRVPLGGTIAVLYLSRAVVEGFPYAAFVDSLLFLLRDGVDPEAMKPRLLEALPIVPLDVRAQSEGDSDVQMTQIINIFDIYLPAALFVVVGVALTLLVLTLHRTVRAQRVQIGVLLALGHRAVAVAASYLPLAVVPALAGTLVGSAAHGAYSRFITATFTSSLGLAPLRDPGLGPELVVASVGCLLLAAVGTLGPALLTARRRPLRLLRPTLARVGPRSPLRRVFARLRDALRVPLGVVIGLGYLWRRPWTTLVTVGSLGLTFALVIAFACVHVTHERETEAAVGRLHLEAFVQFSEPVGEAVLAETARRVDGEVEASIVLPALVGYPDGSTMQPLWCVEPDGWASRLPIARGRLFADPRAREIVVDHWVSDRHGVEVGDRLTLWPGRHAPEGIEVVVAGVLHGSSLGLVMAPLEVGRALFELPGLATGMDVASPLPRPELERRLAEVPQAQTVLSLDRARESVADNFAGLSRLLVVMLSVAVLIALLFLALLAVLDESDRAPDMAVLRAVGWRSRATLAICATEVSARGTLAFLLAVPAAPLLGAWLMERIRLANTYRMDLAVPVWAFVVVGAACLLLVPLGAVPAWRAAHARSAAQAVRAVTRE